jgi:hypothetical protein
MPKKVDGDKGGTIHSTPTDQGRVNFNELGSTGLNRWGGYVAEEWLPELQGTRGIKVYKEMRDNDPIVGAFLFALEMLMRQVTWGTEGASDKDVDQEAAEFLESCMYDMSATWQDTLAEILSLLPFGWAYHEIVYKRRVGITETDGSKRSKFDDGRIGWRKLPLRAQETLLEWDFDETGGVRGMKQLAPPDYVIRYVPIEKALLFRTSTAKGNPEGRSVLRNAYRPWYMKKHIEVFEGVGVERDLAGLPVAWVPPEIITSTNPKDITIYNAFKKLVTNIRRDQQEGIVMPLAYNESGNKLYDLTLLSTGGRRQFDTNSIINRYDQRIAMCVLADFLLLGTDKVGSFALSMSKTTLFQAALGAILGAIEDVFNTHAVPRLMALNTFKGLSGLPKIKHGRVDTVDLSALGEFISKLAAAGMPLFPDDDLEADLRIKGSLPPKGQQLIDAQEAAEEQKQRMLEQLAAGGGPGAQGDDDEGGQQPGQPGKPQPKPGEGKPGKGDQAKNKPSIDDPKGEGAGEGK